MNTFDIRIDTGPSDFNKARLPERLGPFLMPVTLIVENGRVVDIAIVDPHDLDVQPITTPDHKQTARMSMKRRED